MDQQAEKKQPSNNKQSNRTRSKVESNDSPEIPDRGETSDILGLPSRMVLLPGRHVFSVSTVLKYRQVLF